MSGVTPEANRAAVKAIVDAMSERDDVVSCAANAVQALRDLGWGPVPVPVRPTVEAIVEVLTSAQHAPMETHDPRSRECLVCPVPLHLLSPEEIASALLAADHLWTEPATRTVNEPLIVKAIRRNPVGTLEWHPVDGPKTGTSGRSFLAELDASGSVPTETEGNKE